MDARVLTADEAALVPLFESLRMVIEADFWWTRIETGSLVGDRNVHANQLRLDACETELGALGMIDNTHTLPPLTSAKSA